MLPPRTTNASMLTTTTTALARLGVLLLGLLLSGGCATHQRPSTGQAGSAGDHRPNIADGVTVYGTISGSISHIHR
jgi:hypothetical protein